MYNNNKNSKLYSLTNTLGGHKIFDSKTFGFDSAEHTFDTAKQRRIEFYFINASCTRAKTPTGTVEEC